MAELVNTTDKTITIYSNDGDSLQLQPTYRLPVDDKFLPRLPKTVKNQSIFISKATVFDNSVTPPPVVDPPVVGSFPASLYLALSL